VRIAPRVLLYPCGDPAPPHAAGEIALPQLRPVPGAPAVFGDGSHPTTRLCAAGVDLLCRRRPGARVLDVGTGTGVLARIARARAAGLVMATDIDCHALCSAAGHAALDEHPLPIRINAAAPDQLGCRFDLIVANILAEPLAALAPQLRAALLPEGRLLLSGFTPLQAPALRLACGRCGLASLGEAQLDGWVLLDFAPR
jgi:ribosomal protein L11 methyltransferase